MSKVRPVVWLEITHLLASPTGNKSGIGYYTQRLIETLARTNTGYDFQLVGNLFGTHPIPEFVRNISLRQNFTRYIPGKIWNGGIKLGYLPPIDRLYAGKPDLVINFNFVRYPVTSRVKTITFIHDLAFEKYPEQVDRKNLRYLRKFVPLSAHESTVVATISKSTQRDIIHQYHVEKARTKVVYGGVDSERFAAPVQPEKLRKKYRLPSKFVFFIGNNEPRKNLTNLIRAFRQLDEEIRRETGLVIAGGRGWRNDDLLSEIASLRPADNVHVLGYVDDVDVPALYALAEVFAFPSYYEGFGMPILEAMAAGTPVLTTNVSSMPEVAGGAAAYIQDPDDVEEIRTVLHKLLIDQAYRKQLITAAPKQVAKYTWQASVQELLAAIEVALYG